MLMFVTCRLFWVCWCRMENMFVRCFACVCLVPRSHPSPSVASSTNMYPQLQTEIFQPGRHHKYVFESVESTGVRHLLSDCRKKWLECFRPTITHTNEHKISRNSEGIAPTRIRESINLRKLTGQATQERGSIAARLQENGAARIQKVQNK